MPNQNRPQSHISTPPVAAAHALPWPGAATQALYYSPGLAASLFACSATAMPQPQE